MNFEVMEHPRDGAPMVLVPAGTFVMGLPDNDLLAEDHEKPLREVYLSAYWVEIYPATNGRYRRFVEDRGYDDSKWWSQDGWAWREKNKVQMPAQWEKPGWDGPDQPVAGVSWYEADAYARWAGRRLPSDAEWEKAARGTGDARRYPWGEEWPTATRANFAMKIGRTTPVGLYPDGVSPVGCHDMSGNVNNWTDDWFWPLFGKFCFQNGLLHDPRLDDNFWAQMGVGSITHKVDRGGGFATPMEHHEVLGCTRKVCWVPGTREPWNGFRTAMDAT
jgi:formylglycine-generating enzyme required for sulfatase activity